MASIFEVNENGEIVYEPSEADGSASLEQSGSAADPEANGSEVLENEVLEDGIDGNQIIDSGIDVSNEIQDTQNDAQTQETGESSSSGDEYNMYAETIRYVAIVVSTFPVMCIYPFLQKYFVKGMLVGAVKS